MNLADEIVRALTPVSLGYLQQAEQVVKAEISKQRISQLSLAQRLGVSRATMIRHLKDVGSMPVTRFFSLLHLLRIDPYTLKPE